MRQSPCLRHALAIAILLAPAAAARAQDDLPSLTAYSPTLTFGTGLINNPVAWVSPEHGAVWASVSARNQNEGSTYTPKPNGSIWDLTMSVDAHLGGRLSVGASMYGTTNQQVGAHASYLLFRQERDMPFFPSVAVGVRNVGASARQDRYVSGFKRVIDVLPAAQRVNKGDINGSPTAYVVATKELVWENSALGFTLGYGNGLFKENGGLDTIYNKRGTLSPGVFLGTRYAMKFSENSTGSVIVENDGWDWNAGFKVTFGHVTMGFMLTEIEETKGIPANDPLANWTKTNLILGYNGSIPEIISGSRQRAEAVELELEARRLRREIEQRNVRINELNGQIDRAQRTGSAEAANQRAALEKALEAEREAARRAAERLQQVKPGTKPPEDLR